MRSEYWGKLSWKFPPIKKRCLSHHSFSLSHISVKKSAVLFVFFSSPEQTDLQRSGALLRQEVSITRWEEVILSHLCPIWRDITATILKPCVYAFKKQEHRTKILPVSFGKPTTILQNMWFQRCCVFLWELLFVDNPRTTGFDVEPAV